MKIVVFTGAGVSKESGIDTFRDAGGTWDATAGDYFWAYDGRARGANSTSDTKMVALVAVDNATTPFSGYVYLQNPSSASPCYTNALIFYDDNTNGMSTVQSTGVRVASADVTGVRFLMSSGNITSGIIYLYGVSKTS